MATRMCSRRLRTSRISRHLLLLAELQRHVRGHGVGEPAGMLDAGERGQHLRRHLLVELHVLLELRDDGARQHVHLALVVRLDVRQQRQRPRSSTRRRCSLSMRARSTPSTSTFTVPSGSFSSCRMVATVPIRYRSSAFRIVDVGLLLRDQHDALVACAWRHRAPGSISPARRRAESPCAGRRRRPAAAARARSPAVVAGRRDEWEQ